MIPAPAVTPATPAISGVVNGGSFDGGFASSTWVSIFGTNLASATASWQASDFVNGQLPTSLGGVSVTINGIAAPVSYVSPTQINVLAPDDATVGNVPVQVTANQQASNTVAVQKQQFAPSFFTIGGGVFVAAEHADYSPVGSPDVIAGATPAQPGEVISLYGTGFGPTNPATPAGQVVTTPAALANPVQITIGGLNAPVQFAGITAAGLYQFNVTVPQLSSGNAAVVASIGGLQTQNGVSIAIQQ
jgi:uncharacterized protein (TIGR03437 family)